jgi:hypothetical protein
MTLDQSLALARELIARRDEIDAQLAALFGGSLPAAKSSRKCRICGDAGHRSDACPQAKGEPTDTTASAEA